ncbi:MAG TPA: hypothetical protein VLA08_06910 [Nitrosopumilus sp.]|nr:hypothetical protein [Nitrosopumilus sp.]
MSEQLYDKIESLTWDIICAKADVDFETDISKREFVDKLEKELLELLR